MYKYEAQSASMQPQSPLVHNERDSGQGEKKIKCIWLKKGQWHETGQCEEARRNFSDRRGWMEMGVKELGLKE